MLPHFLSRSNQADKIINQDIFVQILIPDDNPSIFAGQLASQEVESIIPALNKYSDAAVFGYGINSLPISLRKLLKAIKSDENKTIIHTHRINEILFALLLRCLGGKFKLVFTRHAESKPANFTYFLMKKADSIVTLSKTMSDNLNLPNTLIPHGINTDLFSTKKTKPSASSFRKIL